MGADPTALLRAANPVPRTELARLSAELEAGGGAARIPMDRLGSVSVSVPSRRRRGLRLLLAAVVLLAVALLVAPTFGIPVPTLNFFHVKKAPARVVKSFASLGVGAPPGMDPGVIAGQARKVATFHASDGAHTLWVAPTKQGGMCFEWTKGGGGCEKLGAAPLSVTWLARPFRLREGQRFQGPPPEALTRIDGFIHAKYADAVEIRFQDGQVARPSLVWVSPPIDAGFFFYDVPKAHRTPGHAIASVAALSDKGEVVTQEGVARDLEFRSGVPADALVADKSATLRIETRQGQATIWEAPTRYEGRCWWLEFAGKGLPVAPCLPRRYPVAPFAVRLLATKDDVLILGVSSAFKTLEIRYTDGDKTFLPIDHGVVLYEIPSPHLVPGHEARELIGRDGSGHPVTEVAAVVGISPCFGALPLGRPTRGPACLGG